MVSTISVTISEMSHHYGIDRLNNFQSSEKEQKVVNLLIYLNVGLGVELGLCFDFKDIYILKQ